MAVGQKPLAADAQNRHVHNTWQNGEIHRRRNARAHSDSPSFSKGSRIFHQKFGYGRITSVNGNKLTIDFDKAGEKRVLDSFVTAA